WSSAPKRRSTERSTGARSFFAFVMELSAARIERRPQGQIQGPIGEVNPRAERRETGYGQPRNEGGVFLAVNPEGPTAGDGQPEQDDAQRQAQRNQQVAAIAQGESSGFTRWSSTANTLPVMLPSLFHSTSLDLPITPISLPSRSSSLPT